jgi:hypothetical protein
MFIERIIEKLSVFKWQNEFQSPGLSGSEKPVQLAPVAFEWALITIRPEIDLPSPMHLNELSLCRNY